MTRHEAGNLNNNPVGQAKGFDHWRRSTGYFLAPAVAVIIWLTPFPDLSPEAHRLAGVASLVIIFWITEAIPIPATALLGVALAVLLGVAPAKNILTAFGDQIIFLFIGSFMLARAMQRHELDRRIAYALLAHPWVGGNTYRTLWAVGLTAWLLSMWISNTAAVAMLFPVTLAIAQETERMVSGRTLMNGALSSRRYTTALLLMLAFAGSVGGIATPVGTPPNLIGIALIAEGLQVRITFFRWMMFALPLAVLMLLAIYATMLLLFPPELRHVPGQLELMRQRQRELGVWTAGQRNALAAFSLAVFLWIMPGLLALILGAANPAVAILQQRLPEGTVVLLAASLLFLLPTSWNRREFTLSWEEAVQIDWGTVLLFGGGIALGRMFFDTGLATVLSKAFLSVVDVDSPRILAGAAALVAVIISETSSNTASASMVVPVMLSIGKTMGSTGFILAVAATLGASLGFMLPVSTPPNAIVYGSRAVRILDMVKAGVVIDVVGILLVWAVANWLVPVVLGR